MRQHPLKLRHDILRQTACWFFGHRWVSSWGRVGKKWKHRASWQVKCRRCRLRANRDRWDPWFKSAWWSVGGFARAVGVMFEVYWKDCPWWATLYLVFAAMAFGMEQGWAQWTCDRHWPFWPTEIASLVAHRFDDWIQ